MYRHTAYSVQRDVASISRALHRLLVVAETTGELGLEDDIHQLQREVRRIFDESLKNVYRGGVI
jgi:hypothetical protein